MNIKNKLLGYAIAFLGLVGLALSAGNIIQGIPKAFILIPAMILTAIGIMILIISGGKTGNSKQVEKEVPIYKGKEIIGYRVED